MNRAGVSGDSGLTGAVHTRFWRRSLLGACHGLGRHGSCDAVEDGLAAQVPGDVAGLVDDRGGGRGVALAQQVLGVVKQALGEVVRSALFAEYADRLCVGRVTVDFGAEFSGATVHFNRAVFSGATVYFRFASFSGGAVDFNRANFSARTVYFSRAEFLGSKVYITADFSGGTVDFSRASFFGGTVYFFGAVFSSGTVDFSGAEFSGGKVDFSGAKFFGGTVRFVDARWLHPPQFDWDVDAVPPEGVTLPAESGALPS